jgi:hypothetical protein
MPQICDMGPTALLPLWRKACWGFLCPEKSWRLQPGLNLRTWVLKGSTLPLDHRSRCNVSTRWRWVVYLPLWPLLPGYKALVPIVWEARVTPGLFWTFWRKVFSSLLGFKPQIVQLIALSPYWLYTSPAPNPTGTALQLNLGLCGGSCWVIRANVYCTILAV